MTVNRKVMIIGSAWPLRGGMSNFNERLCRAFSAKGYQSSIYTFSLQYPAFLFPGKTQYSTEPAPKDLNIKVKVNSVNPLNWISVGWEIRKMKPDLVIIGFWIPFLAPCLGTLARIIRGNRHTRIVSVIHNIIPHEKRPGDRFLSNYFVKSVHGFAAMSKSVLEDLCTFDNQRPKAFCPHPIYDNFGDAVEKQEAKQKLGLDLNVGYLLFFGFIRDYKGLDILLSAFADQRFRNRKLKLLIAGEYYTDPKPYLDLIKSLNLGDEIVLHTDFIPDSEVKYYFSSCDVVVQPYKNATQSGVTQIAYHFHKPIITTNVGGLAEIVPDGKVGYVAEPTPEAITDAIDRFYLLDKEIEFIEQIKIEKIKFSWEKMVETLETLAK